MATCPNEHTHLPLQALKDNDRESVSIYLAEMLLVAAAPAEAGAQRSSSGPPHPPTAKAGLVVVGCGDLIGAQCRHGAPGLANKLTGGGRQCPVKGRE